MLIAHAGWHTDFSNTITLVFTILSVTIAGGMLVGMFLKERFFCYFCPMLVLIHIVCKISPVRFEVESHRGDDAARWRPPIGAVAATGYGKGLIPGAHRVIDEVSANALGAFLLSSGSARTIINVGGQDVKVIRFSDTGQLIDFKMNDKCAAGTGRFFEVAVRILDTPVDAFGELGQDAAEPVNINSTCAVFAESEMVSLMAKGIAKTRIIQGLPESVARRIANLAGGRELADDVYLDGGSANNCGLVMAIEDELFRDVHVLPYPQFTVAYGVARSLGSATLNNQEGERSVN